MKPQFSLIESMLWAAFPFWPSEQARDHPGIKDFIFSREDKLTGTENKPGAWQDHFFLLKRHAERMRSSAAFFRFRFNTSLLIEKLERLSSRLEELISTQGEDTTQARFKVRVLAEPSGNLTVEYAPITPVSGLPVRFDISTFAAEEVTPFPAHKTTLRSVFNQELERALSVGLYDTVFVNTRGEVTEGAINSVFVNPEEGPLLTPVLESGLLPGTLRAELLARGLAAEAFIDVRTLRNAKGIYLGNSVRGLVPAMLEDGQPAC